jgi:hypothetical protein
VLVHRLSTNNFCSKHWYSWFRSAVKTKTEANKIVCRKSGIQSVEQQLTGSRKPSDGWPAERHLNGGKQK